MGRCQAQIGVVLAVAAGAGQHGQAWMLVQASCERLTDRTRREEGGGRTGERRELEEGGEGWERNGRTC